MILYLTSDPGGAWDVDGHPSPRPFNPQNGFITNLKKDLKHHNSLFYKHNILVVAGDAENYEINDEHIITYALAFQKAHIRISSITICDNRNLDMLNDLNQFSIIFIMGGYAPTQNKFFEQINLKKHITEYNGVVIALSAGSMNCAQNVYLAPENRDDLEIATENRFRPGLGLTDIQIVPHFQYLKTVEIEGLNLINDVILKDTSSHSFIGLCDGSYYRIDTSAKQTKLYGDAYILKDNQISFLNQSL